MLRCKMAFLVFGNGWELSLGRQKMRIVPMNIFSYPVLNALQIKAAAIISSLPWKSEVARAREEFIKKGGKKEKKNEDFPDAQTKEVSQVLMFNGTDSHDMEFTRMNAGELLIQTDFTSNFFKDRCFSF